MSLSSPGTGLSLSALKVMRLQSTRLTAYRQETQVATVTDSVGDTVDAVTIEDQVCIARQDYISEGTYHIPIEPASIGPPRRGHSVSYFQVGRTCSADIAELQLAVEGTGTEAVNSVWVAVYETGDVLFTAPRSLVGILGARHAHRLEGSIYCLATFVATQGSTSLYAGRHYWLAICSSEPGVVPVVRWCPDPLAADMPRVWAKKQSGILTANTLMVNDNDGAGGIDQCYPGPTSTYLSYLTEHIWFRLYERKHTMEAMLLAEGASAPSIGELTLIRRNAGLHSQPEVLGPLAGQTAGGIGRAGVAAPVAATGAPAGASYVTMVAEAGLPAGRVLAGTANQVIVADGGAGGNVTLSAPQDIHTGASPTFLNETLTALTASRLMASDAAKAHASVAALSAWVAGTANRVTVADDGDGTITLSGPQDIHTAAGPTFDHIHLSALTAGRVPYVAATEVLVDNAGLTWDTAAGLVSTIWKATPLNALRTTDITSGRGACLLARYTTSAEMIDGFGPAIYFQAVDATSGTQGYGDFGYFRDGADNNAKFSLRILQAGATQERLTLDSAGNLVIGGTITANGGIFTGLTPGSVLFAGAGGALAQDNANLFWDDGNNRLGIGNAAPAYPLDVTGAVRVTTFLGVGTTPSSTRAINAVIVATADATNIGVWGQTTGNVAGGFANTMFGQMGVAIALTNATHATSGLTAVEGRTDIQADTVTVTVGTGLHGQVRTTAGTARTYTSAIGVRASTSIAAGGSIGTWYGFYMPTCTGTTRWGLYIADTGANSYFAAQAQFASGVVGTPGQAFLAEIATGIYRPAANSWAVTIAGTERFRVGAGGIGIVATNEIFLDGVALGGNTTIRERTANIICLKADGNDQYEVRADHMYGRPTTYAPAADGEFGFNTTYNAQEHMIGGAVHRNGSLLYAGPTTAESHAWGGVAAEAAFAASYSIPAAYWQPGKVICIRAYVYSDATGVAAVGMVRLRLGGVAGLLLASGSISGPGGAGQEYSNNLLEAEILVNTRAIGGVVTPAGINRHYDWNAPVDETIYPLTSTQFRYGDATGSALDTTAAQAVTVTYESTGVGTYNATLKFLMVWGY